MVVLGYWLLACAWTLAVMQSVEIAWAEALSEA